MLRLLSTLLTGNVVPDLKFDLEMYFFVNTMTIRANWISCPLFELTFHVNNNKCMTDETAIGCGQWSMRLQ
jgi:hypothetical protein